MRRTIIAAIATAFGITIATAIPASASSGLCWVDPGGYARLSVTRYAVSGGVQYHMDLNSSVPVIGLGYYQKSITISGVTLPGTNDQYRTFVGTQTRTVRGYWTMGNGGTVSCAVTL